MEKKGISLSYETLIGFENSNDYLTEETLGEVLKILFPENDFIRDKTVPDSGARSRPDYRNDELMMIVEFDGEKHYRESKKIKSELKKNYVFNLMGYKIIRIPYFVQISEIVIKNLFDIDVEYKQKYPHGFISKNVIFPADYCELGIEKFEEDLDRFSYIRKDIISSLKSKITGIGDIDLVLPNSLRYLLKE
ncbi:MAG TPA: hypothetical protein PLW78_10625 [bacterium]|nr:hypothetical protein [bacterium]